MVLDHDLGDVDVALARDHLEMALLDPRIAGHVDALGVDLGRDLPERPRLPRRHEMRRAAVEGDDGELIRLRLHHLEQLCRQIGPCGLEHGMALRRKLGAHDLQHLDRELTAGIEQTVAARFEHALEPAVARQQGALAVLYRYMQHQQRPVHGTSPSIALRPAAGRLASGSRTGSRARLPDRTAGRGLSRRGFRAQPCVHLPEHVAAW